MPPPEDVLALAASLDTFAHRYQPWGWAERYATLSPWSPEHRYERSGTFKDDQVAALLSDARDAVDTVVLALWADGRFPVEATSW